MIAVGLPDGSGDATRVSPVHPKQVPDGVVDVRGGVPLLVDDRAQPVEVVIDVIDLGLLRGDHAREEQPKCGGEGPQWPGAPERASQCAKIPNP